MKLKEHNIEARAVEKMRDVMEGLDGPAEDCDDLVGTMSVHGHAYLYEGASLVSTVPINGSAIMPLFDVDGRVQNMLIKLPSGSDLLIPHATLTGASCRIGNRHADADAPLFITADFLEAAAVHAATGMSGVITVSHHNLLAVCEAWQKKYEDREFIVCNRSAGYANKLAAHAASAIGAKLVRLPAHDTASDLSKADATHALKKALTDAPKVNRVVGAEIPTSESPLQWPRPVNGLGIVRDLYHMIKKHVELSHEAAVAVALYIIFTHTVDAARCAPILALLSVVRRCGKTTLLTLIGQLGWRTISTSNISLAALFRVIDEKQPSLLIDEADTFLGNHSEMIGIINAGFTRETAFVTRGVPGGVGFKDFKTFGPKVIAMIGSPPETIRDRSIVIELQRKLPSNEKVALSIDSDANIKALRSRIERFAADNIAAIKLAQPERLVVESDRLADSWEPLLKIASVIGARCLSEVSKCAVKLCKTQTLPETGIERLLNDTRTLFDANGSASITTVELLAGLNGDDEAPWRVSNRGQPMTAYTLANSLKPLHIHSKNLRDGGRVSKGYARVEFEDAFNRYAPAPDA